MLFIGEKVGMPPQDDIPWPEIDIAVDLVATGAVIAAVESVTGFLA